MASTEKFPAINTADLPKIARAIRELRGAIEKWYTVKRTSSSWPPRIDMAIVWGGSSPPGSNQADHKPSFSLRLILEKAERLRDLLNPSHHTAAHYNMIPEIEESDLPRATRIALRDLFAKTDNPSDWLENACADSDKWIAFLNEIAKTIERGAMPPGNAGRPRQCPKSVAYGVKERQRTPLIRWKDIYAECKHRCDTQTKWKDEKLPELKNYMAAVRRALRPKA